MKKIVSLLVLMFSTVLCVWAGDDYYYSYEVNGIYYQLKSLDGEGLCAFVAPKYYFIGKGGTGYSQGHYSGNLVIPESVEINGTTYPVKGISTAAFNQCTLDKVVIPETVTQINNDVGGISIGQLCFSSWGWWCNLKTSSSINDTSEYRYYQVNLLAIAQHVIVGGEECDLTDFVLPGGITDIRPYAFRNCSQMKSLTLSDDVRIIGEYAFEGCGLKKVVIPDNVEVVGEGCFGKNNLEEVTIGRNLREVGENSFNMDSDTYLKVIVSNLAGWCEHLTTKCFNSQNLHLFADADTEITDLVVPEGVKSIHAGSFYFLKSLKSVSIPSSVESIGKEAFWLCQNMEEVNMAKGVKTIGEWSFASVNSLKSISIPNSVETIGDWAFFSCNQLQKVKMGDGVRTIGVKAFSTWGSSVLQEVVFSKALESIGEGAFDHCEALQILVARSEEPWPFDENKNIFPVSIYRTAKLYVPKGSLDIYFRMDGWRKFLNIYEMDDAVGIHGVASQRVQFRSECGLLMVEGAEDGALVSVYASDGRLIGTAVSRQGLALVGTKLPQGSIVIVTIGGQSMKMLTK